MTTQSQPFDTDQPLFPGIDNRVDELIKQVNIMEGYGGPSAPSARHPGLPPKDEGLQRKSKVGKGPSPMKRGDPE